MCRSEQCQVLFPNTDPNPHAATTKLKPLMWDKVTFKFQVEVKALKKYIISHRHRTDPQLRM